MKLKVIALCYFDAARALFWCGLLIFIGTWFVTGDILNPVTEFCRILDVCPGFGSPDERGALLAWLLGWSFMAFWFSVGRVMIEDFETVIPFSGINWKV